MRKYYLLIVRGDVEPELKGPFVTESARDAAALQHRAGDPDREDGLFPLDVSGGAEDMEIEVEAYSGEFFEEVES